MFIEQPAKWLRWMYPGVTWRMDKQVHAVYLTFDDGPIPESTPFILETLARYGVKATFFMVGENVPATMTSTGASWLKVIKSGNHTSTT